MSQAHRQAHDIQAQLAIIQLLEAMNGIQTEFVAAVRGMQVNGILFSGLVQVGSSGLYSVDFEVPYAFVHVVNLSADTITATNDGPQANAPSPGTAAPAAGLRWEGVKRIPGGAALGFNLAGRTLTLYGAANDLANVEVHVKPDRAQP